jgi:broad specificity phosphatase PhoE
MEAIIAMPRAFFIRHAETEMAGRFCGHTDPALSARGRAQLGPLVQRLSAEKIEHVYSSDLRRAIRTAEAIAEGPIELRPALREISFGHWEGLTWEEIEERDPEYATKWMDAYPHLPAPAGEKFEVFEARVLEEVNLLLTRDPGPIAVVAHAGVLRVVLRHLCGCTESEAWKQTQTYCCVVRYEGQGEHR